MPQIFIWTTLKINIWRARTNVDKTILFNRRYVDTRRLNLLHRYLNKHSLRLQFALEVEENGKLNFIDLEALDKSTNTLQFSILSENSLTPTKPSKLISPLFWKTWDLQFYGQLLNVPLSNNQYNKEVKLNKKYCHCQWISNKYSVQTNLQT